MRTAKRIKLKVEPEPKREYKIMPELSEQQKAVLTIFAKKTTNAEFISRQTGIEVEVIKNFYKNKKAD